MFPNAAIPVLVFALVIATVIGAVFLRAAVALYNKIACATLSADSVPRLEVRVPEPGLVKAMGITLLAGLIDVAVGLLIGRGDSLVVQLISIPISLFIMAVLLCLTLPTSLGRAILVTLCEILILGAFLGVLAGAGMVLFASLSR